MGTIYRKTVTKALPPGAKIIVRKGERFAQWQDAKEKTRTAPITTGKDGTDRIVITARTYTAKFRDGSGVVREVATGCRDESAARSVLTDLEKRAEKVKGGILTADEANAIDYQNRPLGQHIDAYLASLVAAGRDTGYLNNLTGQLHRLAQECSFSTLADLSREKLEKWLAGRAREGMSARTRNAYRGTAVTFCNWCIENSRLLANPFVKVEKVNEEADRRRERRALTEAELTRLLDVARHRPLLEAMTVRRGKRKGETVARVRDETRRRLERLGWERALLYKTLLLTGLRKGELASITVGQLDLDADPPGLVLRAADEKNREGSVLPIRSDLAADLRAWLAEKAALAAREAATGADGGAGVVLFDPETAAGRWTFTPCDTRSGLCSAKVASRRARPRPRCGTQPSTLP